MNFPFRLITLCLMPFTINSQIISITTCTDTTCQQNCDSQIAITGNCYPCKTPPCTVSYPSRKFTLDPQTLYYSVSLFSDNECKTLIPGAEQITIFLDNTCKGLRSTNDVIVSSYTGTNTSLIIGVTFGISIFIASICIFYFYYRHKRPVKVIPEKKAKYPTPDRKPQDFGTIEIVFPEHTIRN